MARKLNTFPTSLASVLRCVTNIVRGYRNIASYQGNNSYVESRHSYRDLDMGTACSHSGSAAVLEIEPSGQDKPHMRQRRNSLFFRQTSPKAPFIFSKVNVESPFPLTIRNDSNIDSFIPNIKLETSVVLLPQLIENDTNVINIAIAALTLKIIHNESQNVTVLIKPIVDWGNMKINRQSPAVLPSVMSFPSTTVYAILSEDGPKQTTVTVSGRLDGASVKYSSLISTDKHDATVADPEVLSGAIKVLKDHLKEEAKVRKATLQERDCQISNLRRMKSNVMCESEEDTDDEENGSSRVLMLRSTSRMSRSKRHERSKLAAKTGESTDQKGGKRVKDRRGSCSSSIYGHWLRMDESDSAFHRSKKFPSWSSAVLSDSSWSHIDLTKGNATDDCAQSDAQEKPVRGSTSVYRFFHPSDGDHNFTYVPGSFAVPPGFKRERRPTPIWIPLGMKAANRRTSYDDVIDEESVTSQKVESDVSTKRPRPLSHHKDSFVLRGLTATDIARLSNCMADEGTEDDVSRTIPRTTGNVTSEDDGNLLHYNNPLLKVQGFTVGTLSTKGRDLDMDTETETENYMSDNTGISLFMKRRLSRVRRSISMRRFTQEELAKLAAIDRSLSEDDNDKDDDVTNTNPPNAPCDVESNLNPLSMPQAANGTTSVNNENSEVKGHNTASTETDDSKHLCSFQTYEMKPHTKESVLTEAGEKANHATATATTGDLESSPILEQTEQSVAVKD